MDRSENLKAYVWTAAASGVGGLLVGATALLVQLYQPVMLRILLESIVVGVIGGTLCRGACLLLVNYMVKHNYHQQAFLWVLVFVMVGLGTVEATEFIGSGKMPLGKVSILVVMAEILGMALAYANYRQSIYINEKLRQKQEQLRNGSLPQVEE